jgi:hypothetical protein
MKQWSLKVFLGVNQTSSTVQGNNKNRNVRECEAVHVTEKLKVSGTLLLN